MDKIDRDDENKTQRLYRWCSNYALWKLIVDNGLEDLWRRENPDLPGFTCYDRSFAKDPRCTGSILISILIQKLLATPRLITMVSFTDHYNAISIDRLPLKTKIGNDSWYFNNSFSCKSEVSSATKTFFKKKKNTKKSLWPLVMDGIQLPQDYSHFEEAVYFLPFNSQKFLVLILSISEGWKAESTLEPQSTAAVDPQHLKVEVTDYDLPNCSYVINRAFVNYVNKGY